MQSKMRSLSLKRRATNNRSTVEKLQKMLNRWGKGSTTLAEDGDFGPNTEKVVKEYQTAKGMKPIGVAGSRTFEALHDEQIPETLLMHTPLQENVLRTEGLATDDHGHAPGATFGRAVRNGGKDPHHGIDLKAPVGTAVFATVSGIVEHVRWVRGYGRTLSIRFKPCVQDGSWSGESMDDATDAKYLFAFYAHLSETFVGVGDFVRAGQHIAATGGTGMTAAADHPHLHFEIKKSTRFIGGDAGVKDRVDPQDAEYYQYVDDPQREDIDTTA